MSSAAATEHPSTRAKTFEVNHGGEVKSFPYIGHETIEKVIVLAIHEFHLSAQPHQLGLFKQGHPDALEPSKTLEQAGVHPGEELVLKPIVVQGRIAVALSLESEGLLQKSLALLSECGEGRRECVVIWLCSVLRAGHVTRVVHPSHTSRHGGYQIDGAWLDELWRDLAKRGERIAAQAHTHPHRAFHSRTDDQYPIILQPGLYSLVIPNYARRPFNEREWFLTQLQPSGSWKTANWFEVRR